LAHARDRPFVKGARALPASYAVRGIPFCLCVYFIGALARESIPFAVRALPKARHKTRGSRNISLFSSDTAQRRFRGRSIPLSLRRASRPFRYLVSLDTSRDGSARDTLRNSRALATAIPSIRRNERTQFCVTRRDPPRGTFFVDDLDEQRTSLKFPAEWPRERGERGIELKWISSRPR